VQQGVQLAVSGELLDAAERGQHTLHGARTRAGVLHELQVAAVSGGLDAEEHAAPG